MKQPLPKVTTRGGLVETVTESLRQAILTGHFEPGEKLDQYLIAEDLAVSRTPVREAIRVLESDGFIEVRPHYGAFITTLSYGDVQEIYAIRCLLEPEVARQVTPLIPDPVLDDLERRLHDERAQVEAGDLGGHFATDTYFEEMLLKYTGNNLLKSVLSGLKNRFSVARHYALQQPGPHLAQGIDEHLEMIATFRKRDADLAASVARKHLENSSRRILALMKNGNP